MSTYDKLKTINDSLNDIKAAIISKGQIPSGNITTYAAAILAINGGGSASWDYEPSSETLNLSGGSAQWDYSNENLTLTNTSSELTYNSSTETLDVN